MSPPMVAQDSLATEQLNIATHQEREQARRDRVVREDRDRRDRNRGDRVRGDRDREDRRGRDRQGVHRQARYGRGEARGDGSRHHNRDYRPHGDRPYRN